MLLGKNKYYPNFHMLAIHPEILKKITLNKVWMLALADCPSSKEMRKEAGVSDVAGGGWWWGGQGRRLVNGLM